MRHKKHLTHSKTFKRNTHNQIQSIIQNPDLDKHRSIFLGKPGSKKWHDYYTNLIQTKRKLFNEESIQDHKLDKKNKSFKAQDGGDKADSKPLADLIKKLLDGISKSKQTNPDSNESKSKENVQGTGSNDSKGLDKGQGQGNGTGTGQNQGSINDSSKSKDNSPNSKQSDIEIDSNAPEKRSNCKIPFGWLVDLFETENMKDLLIFAKKQVQDGFIKVPDSWKVNKEQKDTDFDPTTILKDIIKNPEKGPCKAEDIKIQYIPFFLQIYMQLISNMKELVRNENTNNIFNNNSQQTNQTQNPNDNKEEEKNTKTNPSDSSESATMATALAAASTLGNSSQSAEQSENEKSNLSDSSVSATMATALAAASTSNKSKGGEPETTIKPETKGAEQSVTNGAAKQTESNNAAKQTESNGAAKQPESKEIAEQKETKVRRLILFSINLLRNMNMYANPMFFDDLYYYYYFLNLDKILPSMDDFFRMFDTPEPEPNKKNDSKTNMKMRIYQQFPSDDPSPEAQQEKHYGYEMVETRTGANPDTNFDWFLNLVQLHPDFYYRLPVVAEKQKDFLFEGVSVDKETPDKQRVIKIQVTEPTQKGGGFLDSVYSVFGFISTSGTYKYLDDSPLPRVFEDVLKDENATFDGSVYLCIYSLDNSCSFDGNGPTPFLKFITTKNNDKWGFPSFHYKSLQDHEQNNSSFKCELYNAVMEQLEIHLCDGIKGGADGQYAPPNPDNASQPPQNNPVSSEPIDKETPILPPNPETPMQETPVLQPNPETPIQETTVSPPNPETPMQETPVSPPNPETPIQETPVSPPNPDNSKQETPLSSSNPDNSKQETPVLPPNPETPIQETPLSSSNPDNSKQETPVSPPNPETPMQESVQETTDSIIPPDILGSAKEGCGKLESALDSMFIGLVMEEVEGTRQIYAFLNYDYLSTIVKTPENQAQSDLLFCRNDGTKLYPIRDSNPDSKFKWATVDELIFERKLLTEDVDPNISSVFSKHSNVWNIKDSQERNIDFPFVVYAVEKTADQKFKTVETTFSNEDDSKGRNNDKIENYGTPEKDGEDGIGHEYDARYCFSLVPFSMQSENAAPQELHSEKTPDLPPAQGPELPIENSPGEESAKILDNKPESNKIQGGSTGNPKRYAMFAWKTRYVINETQLNLLNEQSGGEEMHKHEDANNLDQINTQQNMETPTDPNHPLKLELDETPTDPNHPLHLVLDENKKDGPLSEEDKDRMALERLKFPTVYTITNNKYTDNKPVVMWGILNSNQFTSL